MSRILICSDSFKGTLRSEEVAAGLATGVRAVGAEAIELPFADGGEGSLTAVEAATGGEFRLLAVPGPLGDPVEARYLLQPELRIAMVEMAEASGLNLVPPGQRDPWRASTYGTGHLLAAALAEPVDQVLVAVGGSATVDGGTGAVEALAERGITSASKALPRIRVLCDVNTNWEDAARVFGPQKGADPTVVRRLADRMDSLVRALPHDPTGVPRTGAAGGLSGALWAHLGATLESGAERMLDLIDFGGRLAGADLVITGEGSLDAQTLTGKAVSVIAERCRRAEVPCAAVAGRIELDSEAISALGLSRALVASTREELEAAGRTLARSGFSRLP